MSKTSKLTLSGVLIALSITLVYLIKFPIFPIAPFLIYEPADIPIFIATYIFGPAYGLAITVITSVIQGFTVSSEGGIIGIIMHIIATGSYVIAMSFILKKFGNVVLATVMGTIMMTTSMVIWNLLFAPIFLGTPIEAVIGILIPAIIPFNILKAGINGFLSIFIFKQLKKVLTFK